MSYEIVKSITKRKKDDKIFITSAANNVWPRNYTKWEFMPNAEKEERNLHLFHGILGNSYQLSSSVNEDWKYATNKFQEYCKENNVDTYELWDLPYKSEKKDIKTLKPYYEIFKGYLEEKHKGKFYLRSNLGYITRVNNKSFAYNPYGININECYKNYKKAYNDYCKLSQDNIKKYDVKIEEYFLKNEVVDERQQQSNELEFSL